MYDPTIGEFLSEDPLGFEGGDTNLRRYVQNSPTNFTDPTGQVLTFPDQNSADTFIADLRKRGAKHIMTVSAPAMSRDIPTTYVLFDPRDMDAVFSYADEHLPLPKRGPQDSPLVTLDMLKLPQGERDVIERRNRFLAASGVLGSSVNIVDAKGEFTGFVPNAIGNLVKDYNRNAPFTITIDIGGEGKTSGAINFNVVAVGTVPPTSGKEIPRLLMREGGIGRLPVNSASVKSIVVHSTPISLETAKEIARVIAPGGKIVLSGAATTAETRREHQRVLDALTGRSEFEQEEQLVEMDLAPLPKVKIPMLKTTITVNK